MTRIPFAILLCGVAGAAAAQTPDPFRLPDTEAWGKVAGELCALQSRTVVAADALRREGKTRQEVLARLPKEEEVRDDFQVRLISVMRENVEDVFDYRDLSLLTIYKFRWAVGVRETVSAARLQRLAAVYPKLAECEKKSVRETGSGDPACLQQAVLELKPR